MSERLIILDTETTGLDPTKGHRLTEIGCLEMVNRRLTGRTFQTYLNPERETDPETLKITGLTTEFLRDKPKFSAVVKDLLLFLQEPNTTLVIHNAPFDLGFLNWELQLLNHSTRLIEDHVGVIDTLVMARKLHPGQRNNLDALCRRYAVDNSNRDYHGALLDAGLLAKVYLAMTAGQSSLAFTEESTRSLQGDPVLSIETVNRRAERLVVIRATEEETQLHEARMLEIQKAASLAD